jgi:hypothetical protein
MIHTDSIPKKWMNHTLSKKTLIHIDSIRKNGWFIQIHRCYIGHVFPFEAQGTSWVERKPRIRSSVGCPGCQPSGPLRYLKINGLVYTH